MAVAIPRYCTTPNCPNKVTRGACPDCLRRRAAAKGVTYGRRWAAYSKRYLAAHPWCVGYPRGFHGAEWMQSECTDHILSAKTHPELFWDPTNHQPMCQRCNTVKGISQEGGFGR